MGKWMARVWLDDVPSLGDITAIDVLEVDESNAE